MKFVVSRTELSNLIKKLQNVVPQNAATPILSHCLVEAGHDELIFTATDLSVGVRCSVKAKVQEQGSLSIPTKRFFQLVRELTEPTLEISSLKGDIAEIKTGSSQFRFHGLSKEHYPELPNLESAVQITMETAVFKEMLYRTSFAVSREDNRFVLSGVFMRIQDGKAIFVGADGKRLSKAESSVSIDPSFSGDYILPLKAVDEILKNLGDEESVRLYLTEDKVAIESGSTLLITKLLSGEYPDFQQMIPKERGETLCLHREELIAMLRQISLFTNEESYSVRFTFVPGELILTANCAKVGEGMVNMPVNFSQEKLEIAFNPDYFLDILRHTKDETVNLNISDSYNLGVITDSTSSLFIIMPMRLNN